MLRGVGTQLLVASGQNSLIVVGATVVAFIALGGAMLQANTRKFRSSAVIVGGWFVVALLAGMGTPRDMVLFGTTFVLVILGFGTMTNATSASEKLFYVAGYVAVWFLVAVLVEYAH